MQTPQAKFGDAGYWTLDSDLPFSDCTGTLLTGIGVRYTRDKPAHIATRTTPSLADKTLQRRVLRLADAAHSPQARVDLAVIGWRGFASDQQDWVAEASASPSRYAMAPLSDRLDRKVRPQSESGSNGAQT